MQENQNASWAILRLSWVILRPPWVILRQSCVILMPSWDHLEAKMIRICCIWAALSDFDVFTWLSRPRWRDMSGFEWVWRVFTWFLSDFERFWRVFTWFTCFWRVLSCFDPPLDSGKSWRLQNTSLVFEKSSQTERFGSLAHNCRSWAILSDFDVFYVILSDFHVFSRVLSSFIEFYRKFYEFARFWLILTWFWRVFTCFYVS